MGINVETLAAANAYTEETVIGGGAIKGKNCIISSITEITGGHRVTFQWTLDDGTVQTGTMDVMDGQGGGGGTSDYSDLTNKPSINSVTLSGNKTTSDLNISYNDLSNKPTIPSLENCYQTTDSAGTALEDEDLIPYYNESVPGKSNMTWSGVKSTLKTYFDNIYSTVSAITGLSDVNVSSPANGQVLKYDSSTSKWVNANESGGGGGGSAIDYSTVEQDTGIKWIDGKPIYQITKQLEMPICTTNGTPVDSYTNIGVGDIDTVVNVYGIFDLETGWRPLNSFHKGSNAYYYNSVTVNDARAQSSPNTIHLVNNSASWNEDLVYVTIQYTKATT